MSGDDPDSVDEKSSMKQPGVFQISPWRLDAMEQVRQPRKLIRENRLPIVINVARRS